MNILLGITGSVASTLVEKIADELRLLGDVKIVMTETSKRFIPISMVTTEGKEEYKILLDDDEWSWPKNPQATFEGRGRFAEDRNRHYYVKGDEVLHIELRKWADVLVIAPLSANTLAKLANGICDNLLTCVYRAWDRDKPVIAAPAMNTFMWDNEPTHEHIAQLMNWNTHIIQPVSKTLACGDIGTGAMGEISNIISKIKAEAIPCFPINQTPRYKGIPVGNHPGAFGYARKHDIHSGVDLYCEEDTPVYAMENGIVVAVVAFTGPSAGYPWWLDTMAVAIEGQSGVINYGEISVAEGYKIAVGKKVKRGDYIGKVSPVLREGKERPDIPGHSRYMLHLELYAKGTRQIWHGWALDEKQPAELLDPTNLLINSFDAPTNYWTVTQ